MRTSARPSPCVDPRVVYEWQAEDLAAVTRDAWHDGSSFASRGMRTSSSAPSPSPSSSSIANDSEPAFSLVFFFFFLTPPASALAAVAAAVSCAGSLDEPASSAIRFLA